ncbi:hypothetical protein [Methylobacterium nodulans]|uniref:Uncharacterized protein n=1 Tax=Methylobacterium nodulans (strain LMG 21967 / CNCM I-2342 / ORS 2060) TaxID=460265 RepID=B8IIF5_METNO|nr:hypothetical protein [Methylobacterium nodulans]ACL59832.1 conserved hypothetical protein [Methylobacterium nodulans ORS 2060]
MIPVEILVMTSGAVGAIAIVVAARPDRRRLSLRLPRIWAAPTAGAAASDAHESVRSGASLPPR